LRFRVEGLKVRVEDVEGVENVDVFLLPFTGD
jgi:hypothetical protein